MGLDELMGIDEILGQDDIGDEELGARVRAATRRTAARVPIASTRPAGQGGIYRKRTCIGIPKATFANNDPAGTTKTVEIEPQRDFQPERLFAQAVSPVPSAKVGIRQVTIGDVPQFPAQQAVMLEVFLRDAVGGGVDWTLCKGGTKITVQFELLTALGAAEGGDVVTSLVGMTLAQ